MNQHIRFFHQVMRLATRDLSLLRRWLNRRTDASPPPDPGPTTESAQRLCHPLPGDVLLARPTRTVLVEQIWQRTAVSREQFAQLYLAPLQRYAHLVQDFPASQDGHYRYAGGMLDQALHRVICALRLRQACLLPAGAPPEEQAEQAEAWTAAVAYAVLLQDLGKLVVDLRVEHDDGTPWRPWQGPLQRPYRVHYPAERPYRLQAAATALLHVHVLDPDLLAWLSSYDVLWTQMLYIISGQEAHADILGDLAFQAAQAVADQASC